MLRPAALLGAACLALMPPLTAQSVQESRSELRARLSEIHFAKSLIGLVLAADELELGGARYDLDDPNDTDLTTLTLPGHTTVTAFGEDAPALYLEGVVGYARADQTVADFYGGNRPGLETAVDSEWTTVGGLGGVGLEFSLTDELTLTPLASVGLTHIENEASYSGPGAAATQPVADGIAYNWDGLAVLWGGGLRADWIRPLGDEHQLEVIGRYDVRQVEMVDDDDDAQDFESTSQVLTLRADVTGPTGAELFTHPLAWRIFGAYRNLLEGDLFGTDQYVEVGGGLSLDTGDDLPLVGGLTLTGAVIVGDGVFGWSAGVGVVF